MDTISSRRDQVKQENSQPKSHISQNNPQQPQRPNNSATSNNVLFKTKTVFPWDLFPDTLTIQKEKVTVYIEEFFQSGQLQTIPVSDISSTSVETSPFFSTLRIVQMFRTENPIVIKPLKRADAQKAHDIISRLIMEKKEQK